MKTMPLRGGKDDDNAARYVVEGSGRKVKDLVGERRPLVLWSRIVGCIGAKNDCEVNLDFDIFPDKLRLRYNYRKDISLIKFGSNSL
jgi:hypothetical protein